MSLQKIEDVTAKVNEAVKPGMSSADTLAARRAAIAAIEKDSQAQTGLEAEVVTLYQGGQYHLYLYKKFTDVRLVFAPEFDAAFYGGDPDNFTFPRYCLDMTIWRVYENGKPFATKNYLPWSTTGVKEGDAVFTSGHPGADAAAEHRRASRVPARPRAAAVDRRVHRRSATRSTPTRKQGAEQERQANDDFFGIENSLKSWHGQIGGPEGPGAAEQEARRREGAARSRQRECRAARRKYGDAWDQVAKARAALPPYNLERVFFESGLGLYTQYFTHGAHAGAVGGRERQAERPAAAGILRRAQGRDRAADGVGSADLIPAWSRPSSKRRWR